MRLESFKWIAPVELLTTHSFSHCDLNLRLFNGFKLSTIQIFLRFPHTKKKLILNIIVNEKYMDLILLLSE